MTIIYCITDRYSVKLTIKSFTIDSQKSQSGYAEPRKG